MKNEVVDQNAEIEYSPKSKSALLCNISISVYEIKEIWCSEDIALIFC